MDRLKGILIVLCLCTLFAGCEKECAHEYQSEITLAASCQQAGEKTTRCIHCQDSYSETIPTFEHTYVIGELEKQPTCAEEGLQKYVCEGCGHSKTETVEKLQHTYGETSVTKEPNCTEKGERSATCKECGTTNVVEAIETNEQHVFSKHVVREATCADPGEGIKTCSLCNYTEKYKLEVKNHSYGSAKVTQPATCTEKGYKILTCTGCTAKKEESIAAKGHSWSEGNCKEASICLECGETGKKGPHQYTSVVKKEPSQQKAGIKECVCKNCNTKKIIYLTPTIELDLEEIQEKVSDYAKKKGFQVKQGRDKSGKSFTKELRVINTTVVGLDLDNLEERGMKCVDEAFAKYSRTSSEIGAYTAYISVVYSEHVYMGGKFVVSVDITG